jgi:hypothetical protein
MKKGLFAVATVIALGTFAYGQNGAVKTNGGVNGSSSANVADVGAINAGTMLQGELQNSIDVNKSKVGDRVLLKTTKALKQGKQTIVPKGTQLIGRITDIAKRSKENSQSRIGMVFDRIEGANLSRPITATIVSITRANTSAGAADSDLFATGGFEGSGSGSSSPGRPAGGGLLGSTPQGLVPAVGNTVGMAANTVSNTARTATGVAGSTVNSAGTIIQNINLGASGSASSAMTLSSGDKNFRIEKGATFNLRVGS